MTAYAIKDKLAGGFINFSGGRGCPSTVPALDTRSLRTEKGCRAWLRGNKYGQPDSTRYALVRVTMLIVSQEDLRGLPPCE